MSELNFSPFSIYSLHFFFSSPVMVNSRVESSAVAVTGGGGSGGGAGRSCAGCGGRISDRFLLFSMERYWHTRCLKCSCCQAQLGEIGTTCYSKGGMILCRNDYIRCAKHEGSKFVNLKMKKIKLHCADFLKFIYKGTIIIINTIQVHYLLL